MARIRIGEMLVQQGRLDPAQLRSALAHQRQWGGRLGRAVIHLGFVEERALLETLGAQIGVQVVDIGDRIVPRNVLALVPEKLVRARRVLPLARLTEGRRGPLLVALADAANLDVLGEIEFATGLEVRPALAGEADLDQALERHFGIPRTKATPAGFSDRTDAIDLPEDTTPLAGLRSGPRKSRLH